MYRDLVVPIAGTPGDESAVACAIAIASSSEAHVALLEFLNLPSPMAGPFGGADFGYAPLCDRVRDAANARAQAWRERLAREAITLSSEVRTVESYFHESARLAALHARYADLSVVTSSPDADAGPAGARGLFAALLFGSGRPVLLTPPGHAWCTPRHVVVAWQPRREATRALHDALPLLASAESVDVLSIGESWGDDGDGPRPGVEISTHLARHGLKVRDVLRGRSVSVARSILEHATESGADLIVAGGYGHSRLREWAVGGVTRELSSGASRLPILFSH